MIALGGSVRAVSLEEAARLAKCAAERVGVTRVTQVTALDRVGVPVCVAVRPRAAQGGVCVTAGKGWTVEEARLGAVMEAVEQAWAEPGRAQVAMRRARVAEILDGAERRDAILDLCPRRGSVIDLAASTLVVEADAVGRPETALLPAELVLHPAPAVLGASYFGTGTNGLAAGSTLAEATLHALIEALERDALSFHNLRDASEVIDLDELPVPYPALRERLARARVALFVRHLPNELGLPAFTAVVSDLDEPQLTVRGDGLHLTPSIALARAVTEALQCRLTIIHGGRDDLDHFVLRFTGVDHEARHEEARHLRERLAAGPKRAWSEVAALPLGDDVDQTLSSLLARLADRGFPLVYRIRLTPADEPVSVVRVVVPRLECFLAETKRMGRRLRRHLEGS
jgi:ribosomal protein S12 methylthiotransferase accessory factor